MKPEPQRSLRITFVIPYFYPAMQYGGQPRSAYELARALVKRGHRIKVLTTDSGGRDRIPAGLRKVEGVEVIYYRNLSNWLAFRRRVFWPAVMFGELQRQLEGSDVLHIHELRSTLTVFAYRAARRLRLPYILSTHGGLRHLGRRSIKVLYDAAWGTRILRDAGAIIAISPVEQKDAASLQVSSERIQSLPNMIFPADYKPLPARGLFRDRRGLGSVRILLFLGRLHWIKGADLLLQAFKIVSASNRDIRLVIAGSDDGQEAELHRMTRDLDLTDSVTFAGFLDHQAKLEALVDADALVLPSRSEVFAITAIEALACGCPVVASEACGLYPMPGTDQGMRLFKTGDVADLAAKVSEAVADGSFRTRAQNGRDFVFSEFGWEKVSRQAESIYSKVLKSST